MKTTSTAIFVVLLFSAFFRPFAAEGTDLIFQTPGSLAESEMRPLGGSPLGHVGRIQVGATPVTITRIGFYGQILKAANVAWAIYGNSDGSLPLMRTPPVPFTPRPVPEWLESPTFGPFTLAANTTYYIGFFAQGENEAVRFYFNYPQGGATTQGGLFMPGPGGYEGAGNPKGTFASPALSVGSYAQFGLRLRHGAILLTPRSQNYTHTIPVSFYLPAAAQPGSVKLIFHDGVIARTLTLASSMETAGSHGFGFDPANPLANAAIVEGAPIPDGNYTVQVIALKSSGEAMEDTGTNVRIDRIAPVIALEGGPLTYTENDSVRQIAPNATVSDANWEGGSLRVQIVENASSGDRIVVMDNTGLAITAGTVFDGNTSFGSLNYTSGTIMGNTELIVSLNANATNDRVQKLIRALFFYILSDNPSPLQRSVQISVYDSAGTQSFVTQPISVVPVNDRPFVGGSSAVLTYTESDGGPATIVSIDPAIVVSDADHATLASANIMINGGNPLAEDTLLFSPAPATMGNITGTYNPATGMLTLTSSEFTATISEWQAALRAVRYSNSSDTPSTVDRTIDFIVSDGIANSFPKRRTIKITAVNDTPIAVSQTVFTPEDIPRPITLSASDPDSPQLTFAITKAPTHGTVSGTGPNFIYTPEANYSGSDFFYFTASDGSKSNTQVVTINITTVNDPPTLNPLPNIELVENWGATVIVPFNGISTGAPNETQSNPLTVTATSADVDLIAHPSVQYVSPDATGTIAFKPLPNANGTTTISITVDDGRGGTDSFTRSFTVAVLPVNSPPTFALGPNVSVGKNAGAQSIAGWAKNIKAGPPDEFGQSVSFITAADRPELFAEPPRISANGTLTFRAAPKATGTTTVSVFLRDNGGIANGGADQSAVETFQIAITSHAEELGTYAGLVFPAPGISPAHERSGLIRVQLAAGGRFTGTLRLGGNTQILQGHFSEQGFSIFAPGTSFAVPGTSARLHLMLRLDVENGTGKLIGEITSSGETYALIDADRAVYSAAPSPRFPYRQVPRELRGRYTAVLDPDDPARDPATFPQGTGYGTLTLGANGLLRWTGKLSDGTPVSYGNLLSSTNTWPVHMLAYEGRGSVTGRLTLSDFANPRLSGDLDWFSPSSAKSRRYPSRWPEGIHVSAIGRKFVTPPPPKPPTAFPGVGPVMPLGNARLQLSAIDVPLFAPRLNIYPTNRVVVLPPAANEVQLQLGPNGVFTGTYTNPITKRASPIAGVILQPDKRGAGFILTPEHSGSVTLTPLEN